MFEQIKNIDKQGTERKNGVKVRRPTSGSGSYSKGSDDNNRFKTSPSSLSKPKAANMAQSVA
jgi:hypothetical protein